MNEIWVVGCEPIETLSELSFFTSSTDAYRRFFDTIKQIDCTDPIMETEDGLYCNTLGAALCFFCYKRKVK